MLPLPDRRLSPRACVLAAADAFGRDQVVAWCEDLLAGVSVAGDPHHPDITWLKGVIGWPAYWSQVWGARGLLHAGPPAHPSVVLAATRSPSWRVREMALKVIAVHGLDDPDGVVDALVDDPIDRVRRQAWRALGLASDGLPR